MSDRRARSPDDDASAAQAKAAAAFAAELERLLGPELRAQGAPVRGKSRTRMLALALGATSLLVFAAPGLRLPAFAPAGSPPQKPGQPRDAAAVVEKGEGVRAPAPVAAPSALPSPIPGAAASAHAPPPDAAVPLLASRGAPAPANDGSAMQRAEPSSPPEADDPFAGSAVAAAESDNDSRVTTQSLAEAPPQVTAALPAPLPDLPAISPGAAEPSAEEGPPARHEPVQAAPLFAPPEALPDLKPSEPQTPQAVRKSESQAEPVAPPKELSLLVPVEVAPPASVPEAPSDDPQAASAMPDDGSVPPLPTEAMASIHEPSAIGDRAIGEPSAGAAAPVTAPPLPEAGPAGPVAGADTAIAEADPSHQAAALDAPAAAGDNLVPSAPDMDAPDRAQPAASAVAPTQDIAAIPAVPITPSLPETGQQRIVEQQNVEQEPAVSQDLSATREASSGEPAGSAPAVEIHQDHLTGVAAERSVADHPPAPIENFAIASVEPPTAVADASPLLEEPPDTPRETAGMPALDVADIGPLPALPPVVDDPLEPPLIEGAPVAEAAPPAIAVAGSATPPPAADSAERPVDPSTADESAAPSVEIVLPAAAIPIDVPPIVPPEPVGVAQADTPDPAIRPEPAQPAPPAPPIASPVASAPTVEIPVSPPPPAPDRLAALPVPPAPGAMPLDKGPAPASRGAAAGTGHEVEQLVERAKRLLDGRDLRSARLLLERAVESGSGEGAYYLAQTFDGRQLARLRLRGVTPDNARAKDLYAIAARAGVAEAGRRLRELQD